MLGMILRILALTGVYLLVLTSVAPGDIAVGLVLATALVVAARLRTPWPARPAGTSPLGRALGIPALVAGTIADLTRGSAAVAACCLGRRPPAPGVVSVPIGETAASSAAAWAVRVGIAPDSVVVDIDEEQGRMLLHVLDASDPDAVRAGQLASYRRYQRRVFP